MVVVKPKKVKETDYPTAGRYDPQNGIFDKNIKCNEDYGSPFLTTAARFSDQHDMSRRNSHLGPNTYELENMSLAEKSRLEAKNKQTLKGMPFRYGPRTGPSKSDRSRAKLDVKVDDHRLK